VTSEHSYDITNGKAYEVVRCDEHKNWWRPENGDWPECPDPCDKCVYVEKSP
jgi:hypothetical protein